MSAFSAIIGQTVKASFRAGGGALTGLLFFLTVVTVFPFGVGPDLNLLARIGPAVLWIGVLLSLLLGLDRLFGQDREDGALELIMVSGEPLALFVFARAAGYWLAHGLPIVVVAPILGLILNLDVVSLAAVTATLVVGSPALAMIGAVGGALTAGLARGGMLAAILVLPLSIPVLIFGVAAVNGAIADPDPFLAPFLILCAFTMFSAVLAPIAGAAALRLGLD
ncbi:heme exporter protein B [Rhodopseudomonas julia]|uniref:Heme exporter protein B n=1 Tax=Rhodopseudomonas julia TaxID=200617 RepID=A0ABU0C563_9BRAD|nr:heme exporter protein CcmB [Rhodopseudomonas julia]MDQ0325663.1 heme exporter protein B [Rhodopseudomonas julia]